MAGTTDILMIGVVLIGGVILFKALPGLIQQAQGQGGVGTTSCANVNVGDAGCPSCVSTNGTNCVCMGNSGCSCNDTSQCQTTMTGGGSSGSSSGSGSGSVSCSGSRCLIDSSSGKCICQGGPHIGKLCSSCKGKAPPATHAASPANKSSASAPSPNPHPFSSFIPGLKPTTAVSPPAKICPPLVKC